MTYKAICLLTATLSLSVSVQAFETSTLEDKTIKSVANTEVKQELMTNLERFTQLTANFTQQVFDEEGELLQTASGNIKLKKPNLIHWQTNEPDESLIISDGKDLWFYDPFIEQASVYTLTNAIANTPILLLTSQDKTLWQNYDVSKIDEQSYDIISLDENSQVKSLNIKFDGSTLTSFTIKDVTGQISQITLSEQDSELAIDNSQFTFTAPEGVHIDDQR